MYKNWNSICWWECEMVQSLWKTVWCFLKKIKNKITIWCSNSTSGYIFKRIKNKISKRCLCSYVHSSIIHHHQNVKATLCPSMNKYINKMYKILFNISKKGNFDTRYNMNNPWGHYTKWNKLVHLYERPSQIHRKRKSRMMVTREWGEGGKGMLLLNRYRVSVLKDDKFLEVGCTSMWTYVTLNWLR